MTQLSNVFGSRSTFDTGRGEAVIYRLDSLAKAGIADVSRLPVSLRVLLENLLRNFDGRLVTEEQIVALASWKPNSVPDQEIAFMPARVVLQDFTGVPAVVDLAAMRSAVARRGGDPRSINPVVPADLVIDHSVQVDAFGTPEAFAFNVQREFERNRERYALLRWAQKAFDNLRVVPPGTGIVHQVNLEYLAKVVQTKEVDGRVVAFPDTLVGTDSHTPMINGLGVLGWGVGGIEAEAVMLPAVPHAHSGSGGCAGVAAGRDGHGPGAHHYRKCCASTASRSCGVLGPGLDRLPLADRPPSPTWRPVRATVGFFGGRRSRCVFAVHRARSGWWSW